MKIRNSIIIVILFLITSCSEREVYKRVSTEGKQMSSEKTLPIFEKPSYKSRILKKMQPKEVEVKKVINGWRYIEDKGERGYLPPANIQYNEEDEIQKLDIPVTGQFPEYINGCEAVSIKMLMDKFDLGKTKYEVAEEIPKDMEIPEYNDMGQIEIWGNPNKGFVGSIEGGQNIGYSIYPQAVVSYLRNYFEAPVDLTGSNTEILERYIKSGSPVVVWVTVNFQEPEEFFSWRTEDGEEIQATFSMHAMTLTGFDSENYYLNDPFTETKDYVVLKKDFDNIWTKMGKMAVSID